MTKQESLEWLAAHPKVKAMLDGLEHDGVLKNLDTLFHTDGGSTELIGVAHAAGYHTAARQHGSGI